MRDIKIIVCIVVSGVSAYVAGATSNVGLVLFCGALSFLLGVGAVIALMEGL